MAIVETKVSILKRLQEEAARTWGVDAADIKNGGFDPLVNLLLGAMAVESEKVWQEMEISRSRIVKRVVETILPEVITGIIPSHAVMMATYQSEPVEVAPRDQFSGPGSDAACFSPAGNFVLPGAKVQYLASGISIDKIGMQNNREPLIKLPSDKPIAAQCLWIGLDISAGYRGDVCLFFNTVTNADRAKLLSVSSSLRFSEGVKKFSLAERFLTSFQGIQQSNSSLPGSGDIPNGYGRVVRDYYQPHFVTIADMDWATLRRKFPEEWDNKLEPAEKALFYQDLVWVKAVFQTSTSATLIDKVEICTNCFPVMQRKLVRQRAKLQPLFNVYALADETEFLGIEEINNGDGEALRPSSLSDIRKEENVYSLRNRNVARFDRRDAFEKLADVTTHLRDDLSAFNSLDNSIINTHLETVNKGLSKLREHLDSFETRLPPIYLMVRTKSGNGIIDISYWTSKGVNGNGVAANTRLIGDAANTCKTENALLLLPSSGGRAPLNEGQMMKEFRDSILTRGRAVTTEDYRIIARSIVGDAASSIEIRKGLGIGQNPKEGIRQIIEMTISPDPNVRADEDFWLNKAQHIKNNLEQKSLGVLPLFVSVKGFNWKL